MTTTSLARNIDAAYAAAEPLEREWHQRRSRTWIDDYLLCMGVWYVSQTKVLAPFFARIHMDFGGVDWDVPVAMLLVVAVWHMVRHMIFSLHVRKRRPSNLVALALFGVMWSAIIWTLGCRTI
jgi:hypothetical protein